jgi:hypothetical protein
MIPLSLSEWQAEGRRRFGEDEMRWRFVCPSCGHIASVQDWKDAGASIRHVAFSCVGRWRGGDDKKTFKKKGGPCYYAGGGLIGLNPVAVVQANGQVVNIFDFAEGDGGPHD